MYIPTYLIIIIGVEYWYLLWLSHRYFFGRVGVFERGIAGGWGWGRCVIVFPWFGVIVGVMVAFKIGLVIKVVGMIRADSSHPKNNIYIHVYMINFK